MKIKIVSLAVLLGFVIACTDEDPLTPDASACFEYSPITDIMPGDTIAFTNCSEDATLFAWDFGDGDLSFDENPKHAYENSGVYEVILGGNVCCKKHVPALFLSGVQRQTTQPLTLRLFVNYRVSTARRLYVQNLM